MPVTAADLTSAIREELEERISRGDHRFAINSGDCEDFAYAVTDRLGGEDDDLDVVDTSNFCVDGDRFEPFDCDLLREHHPASIPPRPLTWDDIARSGMGHHVWLLFDGRHYDAEVPEGVDSIFDLPFNRRNIVNRMRAEHPEIFASLAKADPWWRDSLAMREEFLAWNDARHAPEAERESTAPGFL